MRIKPAFNLKQNYPNPFNPSTTIEYSVPGTENVTIKLYDITGREVETLLNKVVAPGHHIINMNAGGLSSGVYFYRITIRPRSGEFSSDRFKTGDFTAVKKLILIK